MFLFKKLYRPGFNLKKLTSAENTDEFLGQTLTGASDRFDKEAASVLDSVILALEKRYEDVNEGLLNATKIANLNTWPPDFVAVKVVILEFKSRKVKNWLRNQLKYLLKPQSFVWMTAGYQNKIVFSEITDILKFSTRYFRLHCILSFCTVIYFNSSLIQLASLLISLLMLFFRLWR